MRRATRFNSSRHPSDVGKSFVTAIRSNPGDFRGGTEQPIAGLSWTMKSSPDGPKRTRSWTR